MRLKITDFGLSRVTDTYYRHRKDESDKGKKNKASVALRYCPPEQFDNYYDHNGDIWSFGVVLWEIFTFGATPYEKLTAPQIMDLVKNSDNKKNQPVLARPEICPNNVFEIMLKCWSFQATDRPSFSSIYFALRKCLRKEGEQVEDPKIDENPTNDNDNEYSTYDQDEGNGDYTNVDN